MSQALSKPESEMGHTSRTSGLQPTQPTAADLHIDGVSTEARHSESSRLRTRRSSDRQLLTVAASSGVPVPPPPSSLSNVLPMQATSAPRMRYRTNPRLPIGPAPQSGPATMYWSKAPIWGTLPRGTMRGHTAIVVDTVIWIFGGSGSDQKCWNDTWCLDTGKSLV